MIGELHLRDLLNCSPKFLHDLSSLGSLLQIQIYFSTNIFLTSTSYLLITLTGNEDTKMNKILKLFTVISEIQEYKLKIIIACSMCSNEVCAK